jgi:ABC-type phosphate transport system substrate-binding protein
MVIVAGVVWLLAAVAPSADPIAVIANQRNSVQQVTVGQVAAIYRGEELHWPNGERVKIVNREVSAPIRAEFYRKVLNAKPDQPYYHLNTPVPIQNLIERSDEGVMRFVGAIEGAIGYVRLSKINGGDPGIKVILILD